MAIVIVLKFPDKIPSVNDYLLPGLIRKKVYNKKTKKYEIKHVPTLRKSSKAKEYQSYALSQLRKIVKSEEKNEMRSWKWFKIKIEVVFKSSFLARDADNIIKLTNDVVFNQFLKIDDKYVNSVTSEKYDGQGHTNEFMILTISESDDNRDKFKKK